jgi:hypothetical protein
LESSEIGAFLKEDCAEEAQDHSVRVSSARMGKIFIMFKV